MKRGLLSLFLVVLAVATCGSPAASIGPEPSPATSTAAIGPSASPSPSPEAATPAITPSPTINVAREARACIVALAAIGPRVAGTQGEQKAATYISETLRAAGYEPATQSFTATGWRGRISSANVVAVKTGESPREIVVGAHYDSTPGSIGADDNASGVAVLLEVARLLADEPTPYTIRFVAFGAEEAGFLGSAHFVARLSSAERSNVVAMVNLDSVVAGDFQYVYSGEGTRAAGRDWVLAWAAAQGLDLRTVRNVDLNDEEGNPSSDYGAFQAAGIPFLYFEATNWTVGDDDGWTQVNPKYAARGVIRHTRFDTLDWIDATFPGRVDARLELTVAVLRAYLTEGAAEA